MDDLKLIELAITTTFAITGNNYQLFEYETSDRLAIHSAFRLRYKTEFITFVICQLAGNSAKFLTIINNTNLTDNIAVKFNEKGVKTF